MKRLMKMILTMRMRMMKRRMKRKTWLRKKKVSLMTSLMSKESLWAKIC
jgi:hypothetical protein